MRSATAMFSTMVPRMVLPVASVSSQQQPLEALLDVVRQQLERADIERLAEFLDFLEIELHGVASYK